MATTYNNLYMDIRQTLRRAGIEAATLEARELMCFASGKTRSQLVQDGQLYVPPAIEERARDLVCRHLAGEPVAYLIGEWEFYGLPLDISESVLIPRPDTETLVDHVVAWLRPLPECRVLDLCAGSGCIGLMTLLACKACGATDITVVDMAQKRLDYAMKLGATRVINAKEKDVLKEVEAFTNGVGIEKVFETAGSPVTIAQTPYLVKKGGTITLVCMAADPEVKFNFGQIMAKEARIESVFRYRNLYAKAISAVANGIDIGMVATHEFDFEHIQEAYEAAINDKENVVKAVIKL